MEVFDFDAKKLGESEQTLAKLSSEQGRAIIANEEAQGRIRDGRLPHKRMGTALFEVGQILGSRGNVASKALQNGGVIYAHIESIQADGSLGIMNLQLQGLNFTSRQIMGRRSNPFYELYRRVDSPRGVIW